MKHLLTSSSIIFLLAFTSVNGFGQSEQGTVRSCDSVFNELAIGWRQDSNTTTGYRLQNFKRILACQALCVDSSYVLSKLGRPNELYTTSWPIITYFLYDGLQFPKDKSSMLYALRFYYDDKGQLLSVKEIFMQ